MIFTTEIGKLALSSAFLSGQFLYGHRCICTVRGCLRSPSIARAPGKAWTGSLLKLMSPFFLLSQLCFVQPWHNLNLKQLQFTWYYNIQGKNPSDRWFAQFHPLWKHKCYKSRKEESCFGMLRNTVSVNATCCMWIKPIEFVNTELPIITQERDLRIITVLWKHQAECSGMVQGKNSVKDDYKRNSKHRLSPYKLKFCPHLQFYAQF